MRVIRNYRIIELLSILAWIELDSIQIASDTCTYRNIEWSRYLILFISFYKEEAANIYKYIVLAFG